MNLAHFPKISDIKNLQCKGTLEILIANHWLTIRNEEVLPLIQLSSPSKSLLNEDDHSIYHDSIAIVGMSCRYPGCNNLDEFWNLLVQGQDSTSHPPPFRWLREQTPHFNLEARNTYAGFLKTPVDEFDSNFFGNCRNSIP